MMSTWCPHGVHMASTWCPHGVHMVSTWCPHGVHMVSTLGSGDSVCKDELLESFLTKSNSHLPTIIQLFINKLNNILAHCKPLVTKKPK